MADVLIFTDERQQITGTIQKKQTKKKTDTLLLQLSSFPPQGPQLAVV